MRSTPALFRATLGLVAWVSIMLQAVQTVGAADLVFGQSAALSGPARALGQGMRVGLLAAFEAINQQGGIHGQRLVLDSLDDAYEPEAAIANTRELIQRNVFALVGAVGTPTSLAAQPIATEAGVPYLAPFTGAEFLRDAQLRPNVLNMRASYYQETEEMVARLTADLDVQRIGILYQNDSYGRAGLRAYAVPSPVLTCPSLRKRTIRATPRRSRSPCSTCAAPGPRQLSSSGPTGPRPR